MVAAEIESVLADVTQEKNKNHLNQNKNMVFGRIFDMFSGEPKLPPGPTRLPQYFPVEPKGCEKVAQKLFTCITEDATAKARDMEKAGFHKSYFPDVEVQPADVKFAKLAAESDDPALPKPDENPLDQCRSQIAYYQRCCDRELKKKKNWLLTEPYRVQEEYRYDQEQRKEQSTQAASTAK